MTKRKALAGLIYQDSEQFDVLMRQLVADFGARGVKLGGLLQRADAESTWVTRIDDGRSLDLMQDLGACSDSCRLNPQKLAEAAGWLGENLRQKPDLLLISRFGHFEAEGGGYLAEIGAAAELEQPCLIGVSHKYAGAWRAFAGDCAENLDADIEAARKWWRELNA